MHSANRLARLAGSLYLLASIIGIFGLLYVPSHLIVHGNPAATAQAISASQTLYRAGIVADLVAQAAFVLVALTLYRLFKGVDGILSLLMVILSVIQVPIVFVSETFHLSVLSVLNEAGPFSSLSEAQRLAQMSLSLDSYDNGLTVTELFMGLWLFPLGLLILKSGLLPRFLGMALFLAGLAYVSESLAWLLLPSDGPLVSKIAAPLRALELLTPLWLLVMGTKARHAPA